MFAENERDERLKYVKEQVKYLADHLNLQEGTGLYNMLEMTIRNTYSDAWARGSDYRHEQDLKIIRESRDFGKNRNI